MARTTKLEMLEREVATARRMADEILAGAHRMKVDLKSTLDLSDDTFDTLHKLADTGGNNV